MVRQSPKFFGRVLTPGIGAVLLPLPHVRTTFTRTSAPRRRTGGAGSFGQRRYHNQTSSHRGGERSRASGGNVATRRRPARVSPTRRRFEPAGGIVAASSLTIRSIVVRQTHIAQSQSALVCGTLEGSRREGDVASTLRHGSVRAARAGGNGSFHSPAAPVERSVVRPVRFLNPTR